MTRAIGLLKIGASLDLNRLNRDLTRARGSALGTFKAIGKAGVTAGAAAGVGIAVGIGVGLTKGVMGAIELETALANLRGNVGLTGEELDAMRPRLQGLAGDFGLTEVAATQAIFPIVSAGFRGAEALDILEVAAKGSVAGLGEVQDIASVLVTTIQAYGPANITAAQAMDTLSAAAANSINSPEELAGVLGLVIGQAEAAGIEFDELTASLAAMSRTQQNASINAAALRQIIASITQPTKQGAKAIDSMGISVDDLRAMVEDDLLGALQFLETELEGNIDAFGDIFGSVEAYNGVLALLGSNAEETAGIFDSVTDSQGALDKAFNEFSDTTAQKWKNTTAEFNNLLTDLGGMVLPLVNTAVGKVNDAIRAVARWLKGDGSGAVSFFSGMWDNLRENVWPLLVDFWNNDLKPVFNQIGTELVPQILEAFGEGGSATAGIKYFIDNVLVPMTQALSLVIDLVTWTINSFNWLSDILENIPGIPSWVVEIFKLFGRSFNPLLGLPDALNTYSQIRGNMRADAIPAQNYPGLADGGIVRKPTIAMIGEAGPEAVVPLNRGMGTGMNVTINIENAYGEDIADIVRRELTAIGQRGL